LGAEGRGFESLRPDHFDILTHPTKSMNCSKQWITTLLDEYTYTADDKLIEGEIEVGDHFEEDDFNKIIGIKEREAT
jgi:hypothetical protein